MNITRQLALTAVASTMLIVANGTARAQTIDWVRQLGTAAHDAAYEVAGDPSGNVYVAGSTAGMLPGEGGVLFTGVFLARYDVTGNLVWVRPAAARSGLATDRAGFIYVTGGGTVAKYDGAGVQLWLRTFSVPGFGSASAMAVSTDDSGNVYVVGTASQAVAPPPLAQSNWFLGKYDPSGTQLWFRVGESLPLYPPSFVDVATADTGHLYIAGWTNQQTPSTSMTLVVRQYDFAGNVSSGGGGYADSSSHAAAVAVTTDASGNIYVAGWTLPKFSGVSPTVLLLSFDTAGNRRWIQTLPAEVFGGDHPTDVAADSQGHVYMVGAATILAFDSAGTQLWTRQIGDLATDRIESVAVDASDALYLAGRTTGALLGQTPLGQEDAFLVRMLPPTAPVGYYEIVSRNSGKCLDVYGASMDAVASVIQWVCHGGENQQWRLEPAGGGVYRIVARHSGLVLDVYGALVDNVTPIIQYPSHGGDNQLWTMEPASEGHVVFVARHSGKALDVEGASLDDGARVIQYTGHGGTNQQWLLRAVPSGE